MDSLAFTSAAQVLFQPAESAPRGSSPAQAQKAGRDFESVLLTQWFQATEESFATVPTAGDDESEGTEQIRSLGTQALAQELSRKDVLGLGHLVSSALLLPSSHSQAAESSSQKQPPTRGGSQ